ncbi:hypothetical protein Cgig2_018041 [Carnegiea gigantea]|uniref:CCHC-type domain-containing protein n=1 Tax=Carnegiea gigantea TaxID=171969 RepID=A0A9Q1JYT4_9CARY|nr:hypothetical protein Cgig2_018041 [Carnegiea gigantea]
MAAGLVEKWQNLKLTVEEETVIIVDDEEDNAKAEQIALCLVGRLHTNLSFNVRAMKSVFRNIVKPSKGLVIHDLDEYALNEGPWAFDGHTLLLKLMIGLEISSEVQFTTARFWVKAYDVPAKKQNISFAKNLASNIGELVDCDEATMMGFDKALSFRVDIDISKPLRRELNVMIAGKPTWIRFKYIKLSDFCYGCGRLGHTLKGCEIVDATEDDPGLQYGACLKASLLKNRRRNAESELNEECKLFAAFHHSKSKPQVCTKLLFTNPTFEKTGEPFKPPENMASASMLTDEDVPIVQGSEAYKRKQDNVPPLKQGLGLLWTDKANINYLSSSSYHVDITIHWEDDDNLWRFTGIYGWPKRQEKWKTCELISDLMTHSPLPWLVGGDINEIFYHGEKQGGPPKPQSLLDLFQETFASNDLFDLGFSGYQFTWSNYQHDNLLVEERLNRFCADTEWSLLYPRAHVTHIDSDLSEYLPILLKCTSSGDDPCWRTRRFHFENMWLTDPSCKDVISSAWTSTTHSDAMEQLLSRLDNCGQQLLKWNSVTFGHVGLEIKKLENQLKHDTDAVSRRRTLGEIREWRKKEKILARSDYLKYEDANTQWFHSRATIKRTKNCIKRLFDSNGI